MTLDWLYSYQKKGWELGMIKLSAVIITLNEEKNIGRCLLSLKGLVDEIVVVDSLSTDRTKEICLSHNVRFIEQSFLGYQDQKNFAHNLATFDYVLSLDADEVLTPELYSEIEKVKNNFLMEGYSFNRLTNYSGQWIKYCGWYPDTKVRLVKKNSAKWDGGNIHESLNVSGEVGFLSGDLLHYSYDSISAHILQTNKYSSTDAQLSFNRGKHATVFKLLSRPAFQFFKDFILRKGFLDGQYGFIICFINSLYVLLKYAKMMDIEKNIKAK
jgi:glycosyltransferase involved in cell wall biosynthesis